MKKTLLLSTLLFCFLLRQTYGQSVGDPAPDFEVDLLNGGTWTLSGQLGKVVFIFFFGNTCPNCIAAGPSIEEDIQQNFAGEPNFTAVGLDVWDGSAASVEGFRTQTGITFPLALNSSQIASEFGTTYDRLLVVDSEGVLVHKGVIGAGSDINNARQAVMEALEAVQADPCTGASLEFNPVLTHPSCAGDLTGTVDLSPTGTYPPFSASWTDGSQEIDLAGVGAGSYGVTITDSEGCVFEEAFTLREPDEVASLVSIQGPDMAQASQSFTYTVGEMMELEYNWSVTGGELISGQGTSSVVITWGDPGNGMVWVTATDTGGCMSDTVSLEVAVEAITSREEKENSWFRLYPNPVTRMLHVKSPGPVEVSLFTLHGSRILVTDKRQIDLSGFPAGSYLVTVRSGNRSASLHLIRQ